MSGLVLSLFPGMGMLDRAFELEGFCVVRGPDVLWGGDVRTFHPPAGRFDGVIGGPPCVRHSRLQKLDHYEGECLIGEFSRVVHEASPAWFLMENAPASPVPHVDEYAVWSFLLQNRDLGEIASRLRRISFGVHYSRRDPFWIESYIPRGPHAAEYQPAVTADARSRPVKIGGSGKPKPSGEVRSLGRALELQGMPPDYFGEHSPFTMQARRQMVGNGVPLPMGKALARAVKMALKEHA